MLVRSKHFKIGQNSLQVKIFLIACSIKEAEKLYTALEYRSDIGLVCIDKLLNFQLNFLMVIGRILIRVLMVVNGSLNLELISVGS